MIKMAKMRTYKNGIFGRQYKGYFIVRNEKTMELPDGRSKKEKTFSVIDKEKNLIKDGFSDMWDAEWEIDKLTASPGKMKLLKKLYNEEIYVLTKYFSDLIDKEMDGKITEPEAECLKWIEKIRMRKVDEKPF